MCNTCFNTWATAHLPELRAEYEAELDAGEYIDWQDWLVGRWREEKAEVEQQKRSAA